MKRKKIINSLEFIAAEATLSYGKLSFNVSLPMLNLNGGQASDHMIVMRVFNTLETMKKRPDPLNASVWTMSFPWVTESTFPIPLRYVEAELARKQFAKDYTHVFAQQCEDFLASHRTTANAAMDEFLTTIRALM